MSGVWRFDWWQALIVDPTRSSCRSVLPLDSRLAFSHACMHVCLCVRVSLQCKRQVCACESWCRRLEGEERERETCSSFVPILPFAARHPVLSFSLSHSLASLSRSLALSLAVYLVLPLAFHAHSNQQMAL